jgi:hypothetical protein
VVKARRYGLQVTVHERSESMARQTHETGCFVLLRNVPTAGEMAQRAGDVLRAYKEQHGIEQTDGFLKDPLVVHSLFLQKPERIEALGLVLLLALLRWRLVESTLRVHVETTGNPLTGWDKKATQKPTACMMMTKFAGVIVSKVGGQRQLAHPLSTVQQQYLVALRVPATSFTALQSGERDEEGKTSATSAVTDWCGRDRPRAAKSLPRGSYAPDPPLTGSSWGMTPGRDSAMSVEMRLYS